MKELTFETLWAVFEEIFGKLGKPRFVLEEIVADSVDLECTGINFTFRIEIKMPVVGQFTSIFKHDYHMS